MKTLYTQSGKLRFIQKHRGYSEKIADKSCAECEVKPTTTEARLLKAIFGGKV